VRASETEEPDLFWGVRGAGWNFGVVTAFEFRLHPFGPLLHRGVRTYARSDVAAAWEVFREAARRAPETLALIFGIDRPEPAAGDPSPDGEAIAYIAFNHCGSSDAVERDTAAIRIGPTPIAETGGSQPYLEVQTAHDLVLGPGHRSFIKGCNADDLRADALGELVELVATAPGRGTFGVTVMGGAIGRVAEDATAYAGRSAVLDLSADSAWSDPALDDANRGWVRRAMAVVEPDATIGRYANENADVGPEETLAIYGEAKVARLADLKRAWDPDNVFRLNHNVGPSPAER
jgi:FAD/FMN-containing dehydrogenase